MLVNPRRSALAKLLVGKRKRKASIWVDAVDESLKVSAKDGEYRGYCCMCMLRGACSYVATVKDGVVVNIEGDPNRASNRGGLCPRGKGALVNLYNPTRIKAPMKRTNPEKGVNIDPGWVEISWDEALDIAAQKLKEVHERDPRELVNFYGFAAYESSHATFGHGEWCLEFGSPNESSSKGQMCSIHYGGSYILNAFPTVNYDSQYAKYVLTIGRSLGMDVGANDGSARAFVSAVKGGMKNVAVSPYCGVEASTGEWIPIIPGADLSFIYALMYTIVHEMDEFDKPFMKNRTNAPYLIDASGDYARNADGKPVMMDCDGVIKPFDDPAFADMRNSDPALEGRFEFNGEVCPTGFTLFKEAIVNFTPEWASEKCGVPANTIRRLAHELIENACIGQTIVIEGEEMPLRPAAVVVGRCSCNHVDGTLQDIYSRVLNELLGNIGYPGGILSTKLTSYGVTPDGVVKPSNESSTPTEFHWPPSSLELKDFMPHRHSVNSTAMQVIQDPAKWGFDYKPSLVVSQGANVIMCNTDPDVAIEAMKSVDYVIYAACYHMDEMAMMSDLLLPDHAALESTTVYNFPGTEFTSTVKDDKEYMMAARGIVMKHGVGPLYNTMDGNEMLLEIFDRAGLIHVLNNVANKNGCIGVPKGNGFGHTEYALDPNKRYSIMEMWDRCMRAWTGGTGLEYFDDPKNTIYPTLSYTNEADFYPSNRNKTVRFSLYLRDQYMVGKWLIPQIAATGVDTRMFVGCEIDELERRYCAVPYYPSDERRPTFNGPAEYDMRAVYVRRPMHMFRMASMDQNPMTRAWMERYDPEFGTVMINSRAAAEKGLTEGDKVWLESAAGKAKAYVHVTDRCEESTAVIVGSMGRRTKQLGAHLTEEACFNNLAVSSMDHLDPIDGAFDVTVRVKIYKQ